MNFLKYSYSALLGIASTIVALVLCSCRFVWMADTYSVNVFIGDQWVYNEPTLFHPRSLWVIFRWQSNPWRQGLGGLVTAFVGRLTHWNSRYESFIAAGLLVTGCILVLFLKVRLSGKITAWDVVIPLFVLSPVEYQTVVGVTHYSHGPLPFLLVVAFCLAWTIRRYYLKCSLVLATAFFCTYTGFGMFIGPLCPVLFAFDLWTRWRRYDTAERKAGLVTLLLSILSLASFFYGFQFADGVCPAHAFTDPGTGLAVGYPNPLHYFLFAALMFANFVGLKATINLVPSILAGSALLVFVLAGFLFACRRRPLPLIPLLLISYSLLFTLATAQGRMCLGLGAALGSRYMVYLVPAFIGVYFLAIAAHDFAIRTIGLGLLTLVALSSSVIIHRPDRDDMAELRRQRSEWKQCYLAEHSLLDCNRKTRATRYSYPDTIQNQIDFVERNTVNFYYRPTLQKD